MDRQATDPRADTDQTDELARSSSGAVSIHIGHSDVIPTTEAASTSDHAAAAGHMRQTPLGEVGMPPSQLPAQSLSGPPLFENEGTKTSVSALENATALDTDNGANGLNGHLSGEFNHYARESIEPTFLPNADAQLNQNSAASHAIEYLENGKIDQPQLSQYLSTPQQLETAQIILIFDDVLGANPAQSNLIPNGYRGFDWSNIYVMDANQNNEFSSGGLQNTGYEFGTISGEWVAFNGFGNIASFGGPDFALISGSFTPAWRDGLNVSVTAFYNDVEIGAQTFTLEYGSPQIINFDPSIFGQIDNVVFESTGGVNVDPGFDVDTRPDGTHFALDDLTIAVVRPTWSIQPSAPTIAPADDIITFTITRSNTATDETVYVSTAFDRGSQNNNDYGDAATPGVYQGILNKPLTFTAGGPASQTVTVAINRDKEPDAETKSFRLIVQSTPDPDPNTNLLATTDFTIEYPETETPPDEDDDDTPPVDDPDDDAEPVREILVFDSSPYDGMINTTRIANFETTFGYNFEGGTAIYAEFIVRDNKTLDDFAEERGFEYFNYLQIVTEFPGGIFSGCLGDVPFFDPPQGGCLIPYIEADELPFYYDVGDNWIGTDYYIGDRMLNRHSPCGLPIDGKVA